MLGLVLRRIRNHMKDHPLFAFILDFNEMAAHSIRLTSLIPLAFKPNYKERKNKVNFRLSSTEGTAGEPSSQV